MSDYEYTAGDCDVRCQNCLERFRAKRDEWCQWLEHDEHHAITKQIYAMLWSDAVFRLVNESSKHAGNVGGAFATQSGILAEALDRGYVAEQLIAFRRLLEPAARDPGQQVISLRRLIDDVKEHRGLVTREMYVCHDGLPFDDHGGFDELPPPNAKGIFCGSVETTGPKAFGMSNMMHGQFDKLMDSPPSRRDRDDKIGDCFFAKIDETLQLAPFQHARRYANKLILHAADVGSRGARPIEGMTLNKLWHCHRALLKVGNRISAAIGCSNIGSVPTPQFNVLENWDAPFAPSVNFDEMLAKWDEENEQRELWTQELFD